MSNPQYPNNPNQPPYGSYQAPYGGPMAAPYTLGNVGSRIVALIIDGIILSIPTGIITAITTNPDTGTSVLGSLAGFIIAVGYAFLCYNYLNGRTVGQQVMKLRQANIDGSRVSMGTFVLYHTIGYFINGLICAIGYLWAFFDSQKQTWGQKVFKSVTIASAA